MKEVAGIQVPDDKIFEDFTKEPKVTVVKEQVRRIIFNEIEELIRERFTEVAWVKSNELGVVVGVGNDNQGGISDVIGLIKIEAKPYYYSVGKTGRKTVPYRDEFDESVEDLKFLQEQKALKKEKKN